jgi:hypothetical protein
MVDPRTWLVEVDFNQWLNRINLPQPAIFIFGRSLFSGDLYFRAIFIFGRILEGFVGR